MSQVKRHSVAGLDVFSQLPEGKTQRPPLLFIHGAFAGGWMWTETFMPFFAAAGYPCYALSLRGHGGSDGGDHIDWHSIADYVQDVCRVVDTLPETPCLIGHSMGGFVVQKYLERHPARAVALLCSVPPQGLVASQFHLLFHKPQLFMELNRILSGQYTDSTTLHEALFAGPVEETLLQRWLQQMQAESHRAIWDMSMFNLPNLLTMQRPPMWVGGAEQDVLIPSFLVQATAQTYGVPCHLFPNMGHAVTHEQDWPVVAKALQDWLDRR